MSDAIAGSGRPANPKAMWGIAALLLIPTVSLIVLTGANAKPDPVAEPDHFVPSRPETLTWGDFPLDRAPVLRMK